MPKDRVHARLTVNRASKMTKAGRRAIARWLLRQAQFLIAEGPNFSNRFVAKYMSVGK